MNEIDAIEDFDQSEDESRSAYRDDIQGDIQDAQAGSSLQKEVWLQLWLYARGYPNELVWLAGCALVTAAMEVSYPLITRSVIDSLASGVDGYHLWYYAVLYALTTIVICLSICGFVRVGGKLQNYISHDIRRDGFAKLQVLSFNYFNHRPVGWLMARMTADCDRLSDILVWGFLDLVWGMAMMLGIVVVMLWLDPFLAGVVLSVIPLLAWASVFFQRRLLTSARNATAINSRITANYNEAISGVLTSKVFVHEQANLVEFNKLTHRLAHAKVQNMTYASVYLPVVVTLASLAIGLTLVLGGVEVIGGAMTVGTLVAFMGFANNIFEPVEQLSSRFAEMQMAQASAERVLGLINEEPDIKDALELPVAECDRSQIETIELQSVSFAYANDEPILDDINLRVKFGQTVAIVGPTGGGKSTLVNVIARFFEPVQGAVLMNGRDYRDYSLYWLQSRLGVILQDNHIFSGTLMSNIRYGRLEATDEEVIEAGRLAGAHEFIMAFDDGYQTQAGERGNRLSAGQKQLVSFARAIVSDPQILIMDEATSSVDIATEQQIQRSLENLLKDRIAFVIAHRLSTIRQADHIVFLDGGKIVEQGTHSELIGKAGRYHALYKLQQLQESTQKLYI